MLVHLKGEFKVLIRTLKRSEAEVLDGWIHLS